jgi:D-hexose-6-phosphate mutarotase
VVVWNPWATNAKAMADFDKNEYKTMVCVESADFTKPVQLAAGQKWTAKQVLAISGGMAGQE